MPNPAPADDRPPTLRSWMPSRRALLAVAAAFAAGLLLFVALWIDMRDNNDFYRTAEAPRSVEGQEFAPLPVPAPAGEDGHLGGKEEDEAPATPAFRAPPPPAAPVATAPAPPAPAPVAAADSAPRLLSSPAPRYPRDAQRRGVAGTVLLRVHVGADGRPQGVDLVQGSGSHSLDRAATEAVRRWRFA
ncbi:MAG: energy transducer TonB, partial [Luteimonas sp.]